MASSQSDRDLITVTMTREQAKWLANAADRGFDAWGVHPADCEPAREAHQILLDALRRGC